TTPLSGDDDRWVEWVQDAAPRVKFVQDSGENDALKHARDVIVAGGEVICFLGCGYHDSYLKRLNPSNILHQRRVAGRENTLFFGSARYLKPGEQDRAQRRLGVVITLGHHDDDCRAVLRELPVLRP